MTNSQQPLLSLEILADSVEFHIQNRASKPLRIWERSNSWGWETVLFEITTASNQQAKFIVKPKLRMWTRNGPAFIEIPPNAGYQLTVRPKAAEWEASPPIDSLHDQTIQVRGLLRIPPSPEADTFQVFVGEVTSPTYVSNPPHTWLFDSS